MHQVARTANFFLYIWLTIKVGEYALVAGINPGIIFGCFSSVIIFNSIIAYFLYGEKATVKQCLGMGIVIIGMLWISIAKNQTAEIEDKLTQ